MRRALLVAVLTLSFLLGASFVAIEWSARAARSAAPPARPAPAGAIATIAPAAPDLAPRPVAPAPAPSIAPSPPALSPVEPAPSLRPRIVAPRPVPPAPNRALRKLVRRELASEPLRTRLAQCTAGAPSRGRPAILVLELETSDGEARIVDASVHAEGDASAAVVSCAQDALRDHIFAAPVETGGTRSRMPFALTAWPRRG